MLQNRGGETFDYARDAFRLHKQHQQVWDVMVDGQWHTLFDIAEKTGHPSQSISARLRDFRKEKFGAHTVLKKNLGGGTWIYQLEPNPRAGIEARGD